MLSQHFHLRTRKLVFSTVSTQRQRDHPKHLPRIFWVTLHTAGLREGIETLSSFQVDHRIPTLKQNKSQTLSVPWQKDSNPSANLKTLYWLEWQWCGTLHTLQYVCHWWCFFHFTFGGRFVGWIYGCLLLTGDEQYIAWIHLFCYHSETCRLQFKFHHIIHVV